MGKRQITLRSKITIFVSAMFGALALSLLLVFNTILVGEFLELEDQTAKRNIGRVREGLTAVFNEISLKAEEWGTWDDSYEYFAKPNPKYDSSNLTYEALEQLRIRHFAFIRNDGKIIKSLYVDGEKLSVRTPDSDSNKILAKIGKFTISQGQPVGGLIKINDHSYVVGAAVVTNSAGDAPSRGIIIFTRDFDDQTIARLKTQAKIGLVINDVNAADQIKGIEGAIGEALRSKSISTFVTEDQSYGVDIIRDLFDTPIFKMYTFQGRDLLAKALQAREIVITYVVVFTLVTLLAALLFINRIIIIPLKKIGEQSAEIGKLKNDSLRVELVGDYEIRHLGSEINRMLEQLSQSKDEIVKAKDLAVQANTAKSMFIARVSHELRTPVGGIVGLNRIIKKKQNLPRSINELVDKVNVTAEGLLTVIDEILDFSKAESGELTFEKVPFNIREVIGQTLQVISGRLESRFSAGEKDRAELVCDISTQVPKELIGDPTKLKQILTNLLGNAVKFTQHGHIGLEVGINSKDQENTMIDFIVWDTGVGVGSDAIETIFKPYKQADASVSRKYQGTGLGLSIVKQFAEGMGGKVSVVSELGKGTRFTISIPFTVACENSYKQLPKRPVIISSNQMLCGSLSRGFEQVGVKLEHLSRYISKSDLIDSSDMVIFTEENLASDSFVKILQERNLNNDISIALLHSANVEDRERLYEMGVKNILPLPVMLDDLISVFSAADNEGKRESGPKADSTNKSLKVLIVDDMPTNRFILEDLLAEGGHQVTSVCDGIEMLEKLKPLISGEPNSEQFDIVLTDISMPILDGDQATKIIRELEAKSGGKKHIPIIAVTAHVLKEELDRIKDSGVDQVLIKPIDPAKVAAEFLKITKSKYV